VRLHNEGVVLGGHVDHGLTRFDYSASGKDPQILCNACAGRQDVHSRQDVPRDSYLLTKIIDPLSRIEHRVGNILLELLAKLPDLQTRFFDAFPGLLSNSMPRFAAAQEGFRYCGN
jgi:hypothetical protein